MNVVDKLIENTIRTKNPSVIGLDPDIGKIPACYKVNAKSNNPFEAVANVIYEFNRDVIDTVADLVAKADGFFQLNPPLAGEIHLRWMKSLRDEIPLRGNGGGGFNFI